MAAGAHRYMHADVPYADELARLRLLEQRHDEVTRCRLDRLGPLVGARCLEVGAGAGSVARMLARAAGPTGEVVATDADPRFLTDLPTGGARIEVRRHDIVSDDLEVGAFDLVHCRALLLHLSDPETALRRMAAALRPGGWLLVEDVDFDPFAAEPGHPAAAEFNALWSTMLGGAFAGVDTRLGARLPTMVDQLGLVAREDESLDFRRLGGGAEARMYAQGLTTMREQINAIGFDERRIEAIRDALHDPTFAFTDARNVAAWGARPLPGFLG